MIISYYGEDCFKIQSGEKSILTDPPAASSGLTMPRFKADIILKTIASFPVAEQLINQSINQLIYGPGEYDIASIKISGIELSEESSKEFFKTIYLIEAESIKLCFLGHITQMPEPDILEQLEEIDILFIPAGGKPFLEQKIAAKLIKQIEPKIVIPSFFKVPGLKRQAADLKIFLEEANGQKKEPQEKSQEKLTVKKKDLDEIKKTEIVALKI
ncbi:MAG: MBL fold metallo-hydrolase [Patescibacteria group bacterium]